MGFFAQAQADVQHTCSQQGCDWSLFDGASDFAVDAECSFSEVLPATFDVLYIWVAVFCELKTYPFFL
jgi:hypothetical protein